MTARELIQELQNLGEDNLDREIVMWDAGHPYSPYKVKILQGQFHSLEGKILID